MNPELEALLAYRPSFARKHYSHAPIVEAIINIGCEVANTEWLGDESFRPALPDSYVRQSPLFSVTGKRSSDGSGWHTTEDILGRLWRSGPERYVISWRRDGLGLSRLDPYENWERFSAWAKEQWQLYSETCRPTKISLLSVRYVNRITIPMETGGFTDLSWYLRTVPDISPDLALGFASYTWQAEILDTVPGGSIRLTQLLFPRTEERAPISLILDFDISRPFIEVDLTEEEMWQAFNVLRDAKNDAFEACITNRMRRLFSNARDTTDKLFASE
jgi:uncharacterized protein (TIGR04255 family)